MKKSQIACGSTTVSICVLLTLLLSGCYSATAQYPGNATEKSIKMEHSTTILNPETEQLLESMVKSLAEVDFEYEVITAQ
jgi:PBP1b-binding outer membrane lipoprotein LpoB